jgi:sigma-70-like protein
MGTRLRQIRIDVWQEPGEWDPTIARLSVWAGAKREVSFDVVVPSGWREAGDPLGSPGPPTLWLQAAVLWAAEEFAAHCLNRHGEYAADLETADEIDCIGQLRVDPNGASRVAQRPELPDLEVGAVLHQFEWDDEHEVRKLLEPLDEVSREILLLRFGLDRGEPRTLEEVGAEVGLSRQEVRNVEQQAFALLKRLESRDAATNQPGTPDAT